MSKYLFIDTNIYLDFYRIRNEVKASFLEHLLAIKDQLITTDQVEMEFKKNRQSAILDGMKELKPHPTIDVPGVLRNEEATEEILQSQKKIADSVKLLKNQLDEVFANPVDNDPVYGALQQLFLKQQNIDLYRGHEHRYAVRELAQKRFMLGYPPRKKNDTSIGDAINWEWIVSIAKELNASIWIVSRDTDYGVNHNDKGFLNDWLREEFKSRSGNQNEIVLCPKLSLALKEFEVTVTQEEESEEQRVIEEEPTSRSAISVSDSVSITVIRKCSECGREFVLQENEKICPKCSG